MRPDLITRALRPARALTLAVMLAAFIGAAGHGRALQASAQEPAGEPALTINQVDASGYPEIRAIATVLDARGVPVAGLGAPQFQAFEGQVPLDVAAAVAAQDATLALGVVVTIDVSGSMQGSIEQAKAAAIAFVESLGPNDRAALVTFSDGVTPVMGFTSDKPALAAAIAALQAAGGTALYEAVQTSAFIASASETPRSAVVLLSDGENDTLESDATAPGALEIARGARVPVFSIGFGAGADAAFLLQLSTETQGQFQAASSVDVATVYGNISALLRNQYALTLRAADAADGAAATLSLVALVGEAQATASSAFERGTAPAVAVPTIEPLPPETAPVAEAGGGTNTAGIAAVVVGVVVGTAILLLLLFGVRHWSRERREQRAQVRVAAANERMAAAQGVPVEAGLPIAPDPATGRLTRIGVDGAVFDLTTTPVTIGSDSASTVRLPEASDVGYRHASVWMRDGKIMLRHTGGPTKATLVDGRAVEWVTLESGEEFSVGGHRFRAERLAERVADEDDAPERTQISRIQPAAG